MRTELESLVGDIWREACGSPLIALSGHQGGKIAICWRHVRLDAQAARNPGDNPGFEER
jgi:hypothetical protein